MLNAETRNTNYRVWDKYSWFLYIANKHDEALEANHEAQEAVKEYLKTISYGDLTFRHLELIKQNEQRIQSKSWTTYYDFYY